MFSTHIPDDATGSIREKTDLIQLLLYYGFNKAIEQNYYAAPECTDDVGVCKSR